jgi:hypothetical protein
VVIAGCTPTSQGQLKVVLVSLKILGKIWLKGSNGSKNMVLWLERQQQQTDPFYNLKQSFVTCEKTASMIFLVHGLGAFFFA